MLASVRGAARKAPRAAHSRPADDQAAQITIPADAQALICWMPDDLSCRQVAVLLTARANPGLSIGAFAVALGLYKPSVTRAVDRLTSLGLLRRSVDPADRRLVQIWPVLRKGGR